MNYLNELINCEDRREYNHLILQQLFHEWLFWEDYFGERDQVVIGTKLAANHHTT